MTLKQNQINELKERVDSAMKQLYVNDPDLIERAVNERSVVFRFGLYFSYLISYSSFKDFNLDCEYNRNLGEPKRTENFPNGVMPDVLLHQRNSNDNNILAVEFKGYWNKTDREADHKKIYDFTRQNSNDNYKYGLGAVIELNLHDYQIDYYLDYEPQ